MVAKLTRLSQVSALSICATLTGVSVSAETLRCSFELKGQTIFDGQCDTEITRFDDGLMVIGTSGEYFVYATQLELMTNGNAECSSCNTWDVTWNEEPYASHAHSQVGEATLVDGSCLVGLDFNACAE